MTAAQTRLANTIDIYYGAADRNSEGALAAHAYKRSVDDLDAGVARELVSGRLSVSREGYLIGTKDAPYRTTVLDPSLKMCSYFPIINDTIAKRNKKASI